MITPYQPAVDPASFIGRRIAQLPNAGARLIVHHYGTNSRIAVSTVFMGDQKYTRAVLNEHGNYPVRHWQGDLDADDAANLYVLEQLRDNGDI